MLGKRRAVLGPQAWYVFFFKQKTAYEIMPSLVGSEMCIRDRVDGELRRMIFKRFYAKLCDGVAPQNPLP